MTRSRLAAPEGQQDRELGPLELAVALRAPVADLYRARELGLLPEPGPTGRWSPAAAAQITRDWPQTVTAVQAARELGPARSAELLARVSGLPVTAAHVAELAGRGLLISSRRYRNRPLYLVADLHAAAADPVTLALLAEITVSSRQHGSAAS